MDDLISRQALMELFDWWEHEYDEIDSYIRNMRQDVLTLPTTDETVARDIATIIENEKDMRVILNNEMVARKIAEEANKACAECQEWVCDECEYRHWRNYG